MTNWINTVSRDHVERGVRGRFTQANHGKPNMLRKMARGDWIIFYSPKRPIPRVNRFRRSPRSVRSPMTSPIRRRDAGLLAMASQRRLPGMCGGANPASTRPTRLHEDKARWGYKFRFGVFTIDDHDFDVIRSAMTGPG